MTAQTIAIPNEFNDAEDWWNHPICKNYESNRLGVVRNKFTKNTVGFKKNNGYYQFGCSNSCCRGEIEKKNYYIHRFIYECYFGVIADNRVVDHINNIKSDNRLENLQLITQSENCKKNHRKGGQLPSIPLKAINLETGEIFNYRSISRACKDLCINSASICHVLSGRTKSALSKKYNQRFTFEKLSEQKPIIIKNKINIKINKVKSNTINNNRC